MAKKVLVVGASRGIGLELTRQYAADGWEVHATSRDPQAGPLDALEGHVTVHRVDVADTDSVSRLARDLGSNPVDVVIHNAGVKDGHRREELMAINAEAPIRTVDTLLRGKAIAGGGVVVLMSSRAGSRGGRSGSLGDYGDSKAALNDAFRTSAERWREAGITAIALHPGWVRTDMGGPHASVGVEESVAGMRRVIDGLTEEDHGSFLTWQGATQPW